MKAITNNQLGQIIEALEIGAYKAEHRQTEVDQNNMEQALTALHNLPELHHVANRYVDCGDEGTCCHMYNEMNHGEKLYVIEVVDA